MRYLLVIYVQRARDRQPILFALFCFNRSAPCILIFSATALKNNKKKIESIMHERNANATTDKEQNVCDLCKHFNFNGRRCRGNIFIFIDGIYRSISFHPQM